MRTTPVLKTISSNKRQVRHRFMLLFSGVIKVMIHEEDVAA
jgi:hypothetical protein